MTDHDLPRAFCLVKVNRMLDTFLRGNGVRPLACISSWVKVKRLDGVFFAVLEGEECIFESVPGMYMIVIVRGGGRWLGV